MTVDPVIHACDRLRVVSTNGPIRVLHVVGGMNRGGAETWLMHVLRQVDPTLIRMDFLVHTARECEYDAEILASGSRIYRCPEHRRPWSYARRFGHVLVEHGPFDIVHSHVHHYSGVVLWTASRVGVPCRVAHSHQDTRSHDAGAPIPRRVYLAFANRLLRKHATSGLAASREAAAALFGQNWEADARWRVLYYGIDVRPFADPSPPWLVRGELGLPTDAFVLGHVGRFRKEKNHEFLIDIARAAVAQDSHVRLVLVGDGSLRSVIESRVHQAGLRDAVSFVGVRDDIPRLLTGAIDVFVLPSHREGLPLVALEAQAAGVPIVLPNNLTNELDVVPFLIHRVSLDAPASEWAAVALSRRGITVDRTTARLLVSNSPFSIERSTLALTTHYMTSSRVQMLVDPATRA